MTDLSISFPATFKNLTGYPPFPWQQRLFDRFMDGDIPSSCNLPTGLGKTNVIAVWLIALANGAKVPHRLVYVVNRRTVVDQATREAEKLRERVGEAGLIEPLGGLCAFDHDVPLAISTLRGQFADNGEWAADPARPAIIVGTVDMIGSRLLFSGYGIGFKRRPLHAGFLGQDTLIVHDEAHLEPAFQRLLIAVENEQQRSKDLVRLRVLELSATSRAAGDAFELTTEEQAGHIPIVRDRLFARKGIALIPAERAKVGAKIGEIALRHRDSGKAVLVFVRTIDDVSRVRSTLTSKKGGIEEGQVQVLTGTLRGLERDRLASKDSVFARFLSEPQVPPVSGTAYLICTSAGEVGVDISADHMVCDLSTLDSMAQRLGRVNRRGGGQAEVDVVYESDPDPKKKDDPFEQARQATLAHLGRLPTCDWISNRMEASPHCIGKLIHELTQEQRKAAFAPEPTILPATDILFDAWAMTTIREKLPGRPPVQAYLHGVEDERSVETRVTWRREVWECRREFTGEEDRLHFQKLAGELLDDYPLKPHELLRDSTFRKSSGIRDQLIKLGGRHGMHPVWIQEPEGNVIAATLSDIADLPLAGRTVILPPQAGGLVICDGHSKGLFDGETEYQADSDDLYDVADQWYEDPEKEIRRRIRVWDDDPRREDKTVGMRLIREIRFQTEEMEEDAPYRSWLWFERPEAGDNEGSQSALKSVLWQDHTNDVTANALAIVEKLTLPDDVKRAVALAAKFHDLGKKREVWQWGIGNTDYPRVAYAKSGRKWRTRHMSDYRHEFGSLLDIQEEREFGEQPHGAGDLILHLVASGHGRGRPHFPADEVFDPEAKGRDVNKAVVEVVQRFARLQREYGRWGLAYIESLLRAADYAASAKPTAFLKNQQEGQS